MKNRENPHNSTHTNVFKERGKLLFNRLFSFVFCLQGGDVLI